MDWFYEEDGMQQGPVLEGELVKHYHAGTLKASNLVWNETLPEWTPFGELDLYHTLTTALQEEEIPADADNDSKLRLKKRPNMMDSGMRAVSLQADSGAMGEAYVAAPNPEAARLEARAQTQLNFRYEGQGRELFKIYLKNILLTICTLGIYRFWAKVIVRKYNYQHSTFHNGRFDYHATGKEKFLGFLRGLIILIPLVALTGLVFYLVYQRSLVFELAVQAATFAFMILVGFLRPLIIVGSRRFNLARSSWNNMRFNFVGRVGELYALYARDFFLTVITLGIYNAWHQINVKRYVTENSRFGNQRFGYDGLGSEYFGLNLLGMFLCYITLGIYTPWFIASIHRFHINNTSFQGARFVSMLRGGDLFKLLLVGLIMMVCTLGFAFPWVIARYKRLLADTTRIGRVLNVDRIQAEYDAGANATLEGLGEAGEALAEIGDLFGG